MNKPYEEKWDPLHPKIIALTLFVITPVGLSGCSSTPTPPAQPVFNQSTTPEPRASSTSPLTAFDECEWEKETNGWEIDCGDNDIDWYREHGYTTKHSYVPATSLFYRKMRGSDTSVSSVEENRSAPAPSASTTPKPKPISPTPTVSSKGNSGTTKSPALTPTAPTRSGVGSGGTSTGGFSTGG